MNPTRIARNLSTVAVASIAAWSSWSHMVHVALRFGEHPEVAYVLPISVDGMLIVSTTAMVDDQRAGRPVRWSARIAFLAGMTASVAANITAAQPTLGARIVAAWPAVALLLVVEILSRVQKTSAESGLDIDPTPPAAGGDLATVTDHVQRSPSASGSPPQRRASPSPPRTSGRQRRGSGGTSEAVSHLLAADPYASAADIATRLGVTERHVRRLLNAGASHRPGRDGDRP